MLNQITKTYKGLPKIEAISSFCLVLRSESKRKVFLVCICILYCMYFSRGMVKVLCLLLLGCACILAAPANDEFGGQPRDQRSSNVVSPLIRRPFDIELNVLYLGGG